MVCETTDTCCKKKCARGCMNERPDGRTQDTGEKGAGEGLGEGIGLWPARGPARAWRNSGRRGARRFWCCFAFLSPPSRFVCVCVCFSFPLSFFFSVGVPLFPPPLLLARALPSLSFSLVSLSLFFSSFVLFFPCARGSLSKPGVPVARRRKGVQHGEGERAGTGKCLAAGRGRETLRASPCGKERRVRAPAGTASWLRKRTPFGARFLAPESADKRVRANSRPSLFCPRISAPENGTKYGAGFRARKVVPCGDLRHTAKTPVYCLGCTTYYTKCTMYYRRETMQETVDTMKYVMHRTWNIPETMYNMLNTIYSTLYTI